MKASQLLTYVLYALLALAGVYAALRWLLPWLAPFLAAYAVAALLEPAVGALCRRWRWKRGAASGVCTLGFLAAAGGLVWLLVSRISGEIAGLFDRLPQILDSLAATLSRWQGVLARYADGMPEGVRLWFDRSADSFGDFLAGLPAQLSGKLLGLLSALAAAAPSALLFLVTCVIGVYFISASFPQIRAFVKRQIPPRFMDRARRVYQGLRRTLGRWLRAQLIMMLITFFELALAFALLGVGYPMALAAFTAVIDALPVLGTGTVLIPWALYELLTGDTPLAIGLAVTYGAVTLLRNCIQAKLLGDHLGLHPLATLVAIYVGYRVWGVWGMLTFPLLAIGIKQLFDSGILPFGKTANKGEAYDRDPLQYHSGHGNEHSGRHEYPAG
ncbi:MAG: sporulation integral membrane protein YtvI [Oscillospiraceae bacterium]